MTKILVTGGSGCLGQHIIKHFQEHEQNIDEIRVLDIVEFKQKLEYECKIPIVSFIGSVTDISLLYEATRGVQTVVHTAAYIDVRLFPDHERLDTINRKGTQLLLEASCENNVNIFIYCSTIDVMQGYDDIINGNEANTKPDKLLFGRYATTKQEAERAVLAVNGKKLPNGSIIRTIALRPMVIYGELDLHFVPTAVKAGLQNRNIMIDFCGNGLCCIQYAGNVAWAFVCAYKAMKLNKALGGEAFLIKDDTPYVSMVDFCKPYFEIFDIVVYRSFLPYWILYFFIQLVQIILYLISPLKKVQFPLTLSTLIYTNLKLSFDGSKAKDMLKYHPLYTPEESYRRSVEFYRSLISQNKKME